MVGEGCFQEARVPPSLSSSLIDVSMESPLLKLTWIPSTELCLLKGPHQETCQGHTGGGRGMCGGRKEMEGERRGGRWGEGERMGKEMAG